VPVTNKNKAKTKALFQEKVSVHRQTTTTIINNNKHRAQLINHIERRAIDRSISLYREIFHENNNADNLLSYLCQHCWPFS
jgi:hypothetical protein